jgi:hypothetical protein
VRVAWAFILGDSFCCELNRNRLPDQFSRASYKSDLPTVLLPLAVRMQNSSEVNASG